MTWHFEKKKKRRKRKMKNIHNEMLPSSGLFQIGVYLSLFDLEGLLFEGVDRGEINAFDLYYISLMILNV